METRFGMTNFHNPYEQYLKFVDSTKEESTKQHQGDKIQNSPTDTTQDNINMLHATGEHTDVAGNANEKIIATLKTRLQSTEAELQRLDQQMRNLSTHSTTSLKSAIAGQQVSGVRGASVAASLADMARAEMAARVQTAEATTQNNENNESNTNNVESNKRIVREAMMRYLSVERGARIAELMTLRQQIAQAQSTL